MKKYKISELSQKMGVTHDLLKHYEKCGILEPKKDESTNYRYYDIYHAGRLVTSRKYKNMGFSLKEISELVHEKDLKEVEEAIRVKQKELEQEVLRMQLMIPCMERFRSYCELFQHSMNEWFVENRPGYYFKGQTDHRGFINEQAGVKEWIDYQPMSEKMLSIPQSCLTLESEQSLEFMWGLGITEEMVHQLEIELSGMIQYHKPCRVFKYIMSRTISNEKKELPEDFLLEPLEKMKELGLKPDGDALVFSVTNARINHEHKTYYIATIPIK